MKPGTVVTIEQGEYAGERAIVDATKTQDGAEYLLVNLMHANISTTIRADEVIVQSEDNAVQPGAERKADKPKAKGITTDQVHEVIDLIENGMSEREACRTVDVNRMTFRSAALREEAASQYAKAYSALATDQVEKIEQSIEDMRAGKIDAAQARVEIDAHKWLASKFLPKRYGDRVQNDNVNNTTIRFENLDDDKLNDAIKALAG